MNWMSVQLLWFRYRWVTPALAFRLTYQPWVGPLRHCRLLIPFAVVFPLNVEGILNYLQFLYQGLILEVFRGTG